MGVNTTADDKIQEAKEAIHTAKKLLFDAIDDDTWGSGDFKESYILDVESIIMELINIKRKL